MPDSKITALTSISTSTDPANDPLVIVDVSDTSMAATGTTKKVTLNNLLACSPTATLASATITGALDSARLNVTGATIPANGVYLGSANNLSFSAASTLGMTLNSTGLGVGRTPISKLTVDKASQTPGGTTPNGALVITDTVGSNLALEFGVNSAALPWIQSRNSTTNTYYDLLLNPNGGNVGIGVTPSAWVAGAKALQFGAYGSLAQSSSGNIELSFNSYNSGAGAYKYLQTDTASLYRASSVHSWFVAPSGTAGNAITFTQAMTLDASGRLLVGQTSTGLLNINGIDIEGGDSNGGSYIIVNHKLATASGQQYAFFGYNAVKTGDITQNGTTGVLYNTVSDYRLKESVQPLSNGLSRVSALKPSIYKWKSDGSSGEGFLAHELAEVVPFAVTGEKDAVNEDGSIKAQSVDMSRVIPILVAAIQELTAEVNALKNA